MSESVLGLDWETRSAADLKKVGLWNYARHPTTDIWCGAWAFDDEPVQVWAPGSPCPPRVRDHIKAGGAVFAWNVGFEIALNNNVAVRHGWPEMAPEQCYCSMAAALAMGLPGALEDAAMALGLSVLKDMEGRNLMLRMSRPRSKAGVLPIVWWNEPEKLARLHAYCRTDVEVEREARRRLMPLSDEERRVWQLDYRINQRGVKIDIPTAKAATKMAEVMKVEYDKQMCAATRGQVATCGALGPLKEWLRAHGVDTNSIAKQVVIDVLDELADSEELQDLEVKHVLTIRQEAGKASAAKFHKMVDMAGDDGRLRNMYQYHGAGPGRWAGRAVQTHNLVRDMPKPAQVDRILELVRAGEHELIDAVYGPPLTAMSRCTRSFFMAEEGNLLAGGDFSSIEGRGQAWFAGEQWKLDAYRAADAGTGPGLYELAYSRMFGVDVESIGNPSFERQVGKVSELAFGYQGGVGSGKTMGKTYGVKAADVVWDGWKNLWRDAHPRIKETWSEIQRAAIAAVSRPGAPFDCGFHGRHATFKKVGSFLWCLLPSGRAICYPYPKVLQGDFGPQLTYMTQPSPEDRKKLKIIDDPMNSAKWVRIGTYGGALFNNIVQGFCRDILAWLMLELDALGAKIVLHTHDEAVIEVAAEKAEGARMKMQELMRTPPEWAKDFPLFAKCVIMKRYGK